jgi:hypothetical protein
LGKNCCQWCQAITMPKERLLCRIVSASVPLPKGRAQV